MKIKYENTLEMLLLLDSSKKVSSFSLMRDQGRFCLRKRTKM